MLDGNKKNQEKFVEWLSTQVSPTQLSELYLAYDKIDNFCTKRSILKKPLLETTDVKTVNKVLQTVEQNKVFRFLNKREINKIIAAARFYYKYIKLQGDINAGNQIVQKNAIGFQERKSEQASDADVNKETVNVFGGTISGARSKDDFLVRTKQDEYLLEKYPIVYKKVMDSLKKSLDVVGEKGVTPYAIYENIKHIARIDAIKYILENASWAKKIGSKYAFSREIIADHSISLEKAKNALKDAGLQGLTIQELIDATLPGTAVSSLKRALDEDKNVITMPGYHYVHEECFVDMDEAAEAIGQILITHFAQFGGYSNNQLLFGAASRELSLFLNDNDCENIDAVYAIARFLFEKKAFAGKPYKFCAPHIFETEPDYPMNLRGLMIHLARSNGGILFETDAKNYLQKTMLTYGGIGQLLQIGSSNTFLMYDDDRYLLSAAIGIDDAWCFRMHDQIDDLFRKANVAYVIPRDISASWLEMLPVLPQGLEWTLLLLQEIIDKYPAIGFKSISADLNQSHHTLAAAFVPTDSPLQSFPDVVTLFMEERHELPMRMPGEELRVELRDAGMLEAGEMIYALPKALDDYRFAWTDENKTVMIRGNK